MYECLNVKFGAPVTGNCVREAHAHLAGVACAVFWDVTVVHCISTHNSHELHLKQHTIKITHRL